MTDRAIILPSALAAIAMRTALGLGVAFSVIVAIVALGSGSGRIALPFEMSLVDRRLPVVFRIHMISSAIVLLLLPVVIAVRFRPWLHRRIGWTLGAFVVAGGLTAIPVAIFSFSWWPARIGFLAQGVVWLWLFYAASRSIRQGDRERHARLMFAMAAVTTGAVWFRLATGTALLLDWPFDPVYAASAWLCWLVPLALVGHYARPLDRWAFKIPPLAPGHSIR
ncbi:MAG: DUF2306 domain-containing protein [Hyphomicrobium sp.]|jgi:hypothetical protein|nr:DUF2306 domain-containing protein [Hyphomicrobium sp.]